MHHALRHVAFAIPLMFLPLASVGVAHAIEVGQAAPAIDLPSATGPVRLAQPGSVTYVDFWASWCGTCKKSFPWLNRMQEKYAAQGLRVIGVNVDAEARDAAAFLARVPATFTIAYDSAGNSAREYGVRGMPTSMIIGRDGKVLFTHMGFDERDADKLEMQIRNATGAAP